MERHVVKVQDQMAASSPKQINISPNISDQARARWCLPSRSPTDFAGRRQECLVDLAFRENGKLIYLARLRLAELII